MNVSIDYANVKLLSDKLTGYSEQFDSEIRNIKNIVENVSKAWGGDDATKYIEVMNEYIMELEKIKEFIDIYSNYLENIPGVYELLDEIYSEKYIDV